MKKPKFLFKIDHNLKGKVYINHKWQKDIVRIYIHGEPNNYVVDIERYRRDQRGKFLVKNNEIETEFKVYAFREGK